MCVCERECKTNRVKDERVCFSSINGDVINVVDAVHAVVDSEQNVVLRARNRLFTHLSNDLDQQRVVVEYQVGVDRVIAL